ncbi:MAG: hypothetical protein IT445_00380 [Phycisphaeraceae bacterium]|nr:hypothetical protein [Phycisphaeraceae bacterium]
MFDISTTVLPGPGAERVQQTLYHPLTHVLSADYFNQGMNGWMELMPNFTQPGFNSRKSIVEKKRFGPVMLSNATFSYGGTHGALTGGYCLKLATRAEANPYEQPPASGSMSHAIKRLTDIHTPGLRQVECWFAYKPEQDRIGLGEKDIRAFGVMFDRQDQRGRTYAGVRYLNSVNGKLIKRWQIMQAADVTDEQWAHGTKGDWCKRGIDPQWNGRRYPDGSTDGFTFVEDGHHDLCYNESDDKFNWTYLRFVIDTAALEYVELQCGERVFNLRGLSLSLVDPYKGIMGLLNPIFWVETDADRRVFLFLDSVVVSSE